MLGKRTQNLTGQPDYAYQAQLDRSTAADKKTKDALASDEAARKAATMQTMGAAMKSLMDPNAAGGFGSMSMAGGGTASGSSTGGDALAPIPYGGAAGGDNGAGAAAQAAAFSKAKDRIGAIARGSIDSLRQAAGSSNRLGSGRYDASERALVDRSRSGLTDIVRDQTSADLAAQQHAADQQNENNLQAQTLQSRREEARRAEQAASYQSLMNVVLESGMY